MSNKKVIYLVTSAASILAAAIVKSHDESFSFVPIHYPGEDISPAMVYQELFPGKKIPLAAKLFEDSVLGDKSNSDAQNLAAGVEHYAYNLNDQYHFQALLNVLNNDQREIKRLSDLGATINYANLEHDDILDELVEKYSEKSEDDEDGITLHDLEEDLDDEDHQSEIDTNQNPESDNVPDVDSKPSINPAVDPVPDVLPEVDTESSPAPIITEPVADSETNTVNSETQPVVGEVSESKEISEDSGKPSKKKA